VLPTIDEMYASMDINQSAITQEATQGKLKPMAIVTIEDAKRLGTCFAVSSVPFRRRDEPNAHHSKSPKRFEDKEICPYHSQLLSHKHKELRHTGPCYLLQDAAELNLTIQEYIATRNKSYKSNPKQVPPVTQPGSRSASPSTYGPSREGPSPKRHRSKSKSPKRGGGARSASTAPPVTGGSHA
jgi:hypothetical protein